MIKVSVNRLYVDKKFGEVMGYQLYCFRWLLR